ncbi:hypothetical protein JKF63_04892 [Porcisia hertigi]|uniref:Centrosomal protein of 162 kDa n=1 Tax=Porcisia hertigi TaxID=2761500 RepID=A0A836LDQ1_9TRYP|nr:hypothetical protein JKF63_04892 [Porcisia hertigi]
MSVSNLSSTAALDAANELLDMMDVRGRNISASPAESVISSASQCRDSSGVASPLTAAAERASPPGELIAKGPTGPIENFHTSRETVCNNFDALRREMNTQERIIVALQRDNEGLLREKKEIASQYKQLESKFEHLEAKHSLLLSAQQDFATRSNLHTANDSAKITKLQAQVEELQSVLEMEKRRCSLLLQERSEMGQSRSGTRTPVDITEIADVAVVREQRSSGGDTEAELRDFQRIHSINKSTIDALHSEVARLESERSVLYSREKNLLAEVDSLRTQVRDLESTLQQSKGSISELISTCQASSVNMERLRKQERRIHLLEAASREKDEFARKAMEQLRAETKEVCERYKKTIVELQQRLEVPKDDPELRRRISILERENLELRRTIGNATVSSVAEKAEPAKKGTLNLSHQTGTTDDLEKPDEKDTKTPAPHNLEVARLQSVVEQLRTEVFEYKERSTTLQSKLDSIRAEWGDRVAEIKASFSHQVQALRAAHNEELSRLEAAHQSQLLELTKFHKSDDGANLASRLSQIVDEKGYDASLVAIGERLCYLERRYSQKEEEKMHELLEMKRVAELEKRIQREKTDLLLEQKNTQIKRFQIQLDELLAALSVLQAT